MIRLTARRMTFLAALALASGAVAVNCSSNNKTDTNAGKVDLKLTLPDGTAIASVDWKLNNSAGTTVKSGSINTSSLPGQTVGLVIGAVPAGTGYTVVMSATGPNSETCMGTSVAFDVVANQNAMVSVTLLCTSPNGNGSVGVTGGFNNCPQLTGYAVSPLASNVGGAIDLQATASDANSGDTLTYSWTDANGGAITAGSPGNATLSCAPAGAHVLTISVSDGQCADSANITVNCVTVACGDSTVDATIGEECDPPNGTTCDSNCLTIPVCGNSVVEPRGMETCDPPNGTTCDSSCHNIPVVCGNGIKQGAEECDPPVAGQCSATCTTIACGNNRVDEGENCDPPNGSTCDSTCHGVDQCVACETASCDASASRCDLAGTPPRSLSATRTWPASAARTAALRATLSRATAVRRPTWLASPAAPTAHARRRPRPLPSRSAPMPRAKAMDVA